MGANAVVDVDVCYTVAAPPSPSGDCPSLTLSLTLGKPGIEKNFWHPEAVSVRQLVFVPNKVSNWFCNSSVFDVIVLCTRYAHCP